MAHHHPPQRLTGKRILVTRPRERAKVLCFLLEDEGAEVVALPLLEIAQPSDERPLQAAAEQLSRFEWILFASPAAVDTLTEAARRAGTYGALSKVKLGAVGPKTARALSDLGLTVEVEGPGGEGLFQVLAPKLKPNDRVLLPTAEEGRRELQYLLESAQADVTRVVAYRSATAIDSEQVRTSIEIDFDALVFTSPRIAETFSATAGERGQALLTFRPVVAIGPTTARALSELGARNVRIASSPSEDAIAEAVVGALANQRE